jgi:hypothetical protein
MPAPMYTASLYSIGGASTIPPPQSEIAVGKPGCMPTAQRAVGIASVERAFQSEIEMHPS